MAVAHSLGFPRIGRDRELKKAQEAFWKGELDEAGLRAVGRELRKTHWDLQKKAGIELLPAGDFAWYDQVLTHSLMFGVIPERFRPADGKATLHTLFGMARGVSDNCCGGAHAQEMTKWFDTNYHYLVPEFSADQKFQLGWEQLFEEVKEARDLGHTVKPVVIGPLTYLWLGKAKGGDFDKLDLLDRLLPLYGQIFQRLADLGVEWVQIDEPILVLDLPQDWKNAFERAYNLIQRDPLKKLVATILAAWKRTSAWQPTCRWTACTSTWCVHRISTRPSSIACRLIRCCPWAWSTAVTFGAATWKKPWPPCSMLMSAWGIACGWRHPARCCTARWTWTGKTSWMPS